MNHHEAIHPGDLRANTRYEFRPMREYRGPVIPKNRDPRLMGRSGSSYAQEGRK